MVPNRYHPDLGTFVSICEPEIVNTLQFVAEMSRMGPRCQKLSYTKPLARLA